MILTVVDYKGIRIPIGYEENGVRHTILDIPALPKKNPKLGIISIKVAEGVYYPLLTLGGKPYFGFVEERNVPMNEVIMKMINMFPAFSKTVESPSI